MSPHCFVVENYNKVSDKTNEKRTYIGDTESVRIQAILLKKSSIWKETNYLRSQGRQYDLEK